MKNLNELKKIYNIIEILEQEKIIDDKLNIEKIDFLQSFDGVYTHKIVFYYSTNSCEEIYTVSIKMLNGMNFTALIEGKYKYSSTEIEVQKNITFMNSGLDENLFILNTNNNLVSSHALNPF